jgi:hypothetical protein
MLAARTSIVDVLTGALGGTDIDVEPYARNIDPPLAPVVMVRLDKVRPSRTAGYLWDVDAALVLVGPSTTPGAADDELDAALGDVLFALESGDIASLLYWTEATRATYGPTDGDPTNPAYEITLSTRIPRPETA